MEDTAQATRVRDLSKAGFLLGDWRVEPTSGRLCRGPEVRHLQPQPMEVLVFLAAGAGRVVSKEEIFATVWPDAAVEEVALPRCVSEIRKTLGDDARTPRFIQTIPKRGYRLIAPVSILDPESAGGPEDVGPPEVANPRREDGVLRRRLWLAATLIGLVAVAALMLPGSDGDKRTEEGGHHDLSEPRRVAALGLRDLAEEPDSRWLATAVPNLLSTELDLAPGLEGIPAETVARWKRDLAIGDDDWLLPQTLSRLHAGFGVDLVVVGSIVQLEQEGDASLRVDLRVVDRQGTAVVTLAESGPRSRFFDLVSLLGERLRSQLEGGGAERWNPAHQRRFLPQDPKAAELYYRALDHLRRFETAMARELLERSIEHEADNPLVHHALSEALANLGFVQAAAEAAERAHGLSEGLARRERLRIEAHYLRTVSRLPEAAALYRRIWQDSAHLEDGLVLAEVLADAERPEEASAALREVRHRAGSDPGDPRIDLLAARLAAQTGEASEALRLAETAVGTAEALGADRMVARSRELLAERLRAASSFQQAEEMLIQATVSYAAAGDSSGEARARLTRSRWLEEAGEFAQAAELADKALASFRANGDRAGEGEALSVLADLAGGRGDLEEAARLFGRSAELCREVGSRGCEASVESLWGIALASSGQYESAETHFERAWALYREVGDPEGEATVSMNLGRLRLLLGDAGAAIPLLRRAGALFEELGLTGRLATLSFNLGHALLATGDARAAEGSFDRAVSLFPAEHASRMRSASLEGRGQALFVLGDFTGAERTLRESLELRLVTGDKQRIARSRAFLARILLERGELDAAGRMARQAVAAAEGEEPIHKATALEALAQVELERRNPQRAADLANTALETMPAEERAGLNGLLIAITAARAKAARGDAAEAIRDLEEISKKTEAQQALLLHAQAELALAEIGKNSGILPDAADRLRRLASEARDRNWGRIEKRAEEALATGR